MLCERCKLREATIQYTEVVNGVKKEHNFCTQCAREMDFGQVSAIFEGDFPFSKILSAILGEETQAENENYSKIECPNCHTTYQEFIDNFRFGCPDCYEVFDLLIQDSIKQLQGSDQHKGKHPKYGMKMVPESLIRNLPGETDKKDTAKTPEEKASDKKRSDALQEIRALKLKLNQAVREEQYEEAARFRDQIKSLEKGDGENA
jgi:protein arginine kinase activator